MCARVSQHSNNFFSLCLNSISTRRHPQLEDESKPDGKKNGVFEQDIVYLWIRAKQWLYPKNILNLVLESRVDKFFFLQTREKSLVHP